MAEFVFWSGQYKRWTTHKQIGIPFFARKVHIPHLSNVMKGNIRKITVQLNGENLTDWMLSGDDFVFGKTLLRGNYWLFIEVIYNDLEPTIYRRWNE
jgi:hypothetical protein